MSGYNGSGTYVRGYNWVNDAASNIPITASRVDADMADVVSGFNLCLTRDGQGKPTADFSVNGYKLTALGSGSAGSPSVSFSSSSNTGVYLISSTSLGVSVSGVQQLSLDNTGLLTVAGNLTVTGGTVTATTLTGKAGAATKITTTTSSTNSAYPVMLSATTSTGDQSPLMDTGLTFNPSTQALDLGTGAISSVTTIGMSGQLTSTLATGTAPFVVASTTPVANLAIGGNAATATSATTATNLASGAAGTIPYQSGSGATSMALTLGTTGYLLTAGASAPAWAAPVNIVGGFRNLKLSTTGVDANVSVSYDELVVENATNIYAVLRSGSLTVAGTSSGVANGLDTGSLAGSTWYAVWVIWNGSTQAGLLSLSATAPTLPGGYTHKARVGWIRTDGTGNKYPLSIIQYGRRVQYKLALASNLTTLPQIVTGAAGTTTSLAAQSVVNFVPSTAARIALMMQGNGSNWGGVAPNAVYQVTAAGTSTTAPINTQGTGSTQYAVSGEFALESTSVYYYSSSAGGALYCLGWEDV